MKRAVLGLCLGASLSSFAQKLPPAEDYKSAVQSGVLICRTKFKVFALKSLEAANRYDLPAPDASEWTGCVSSERSAAQAKYDTLLRSLRTTAKKESLKNVQVAFVLALEGITPTPSESARGYDARQEALEAKLREAIIRFDLER